MRKTIFRALLFCTLHFTFCILPFHSRAAAPSGAYRLYLSGNLSKASAAYMELAAADPGNITPLMDAAMIYKQLGRYADGAAALEKALDIDPYQSDILAELGWLKFHQADYESAQTCFERTLRIQPLHTRAILGLGSVYSNLGNKEKTMEYLDRYRQLRPEFAGVDYIMAWNFMNFKMYREAQESLVEALRKDAAFIEARLPLAGIYAREGKLNEAWNQYYRVLDYAPNHPIASKMMRVLEGKLAKQPEEIRPPFRIVKPLKMEPVPVLDELTGAVKSGWA